MLDPVAIGARIKSVRGKLTQQEFADRLSVGRVSVARYETGTRTPDAEFLAAVALQFGVDLVWMLMGIGETSTPEPLQLSADEGELLRLFRAAPLALKSAAVRALTVPDATTTTQISVSAPGGHAAGRDITINSRREATSNGKAKSRKP